MEFSRLEYMQKLISKMHNGRVKIITGIRRCGKSYLLFELFTRYLQEEGIADNQIITLALDEFRNAKYRNPMELDKYIREQITDKSKQYYILINEIQFVSEIHNPYVESQDAKLTFVDVVLGLIKIKNADVYITGSNSKMLSSDVLTQFRDRGDEIRVYPLSFTEFHEMYEGNERDAWVDYYTYGGMPIVSSLPSHEEKSQYLRNLFKRTYIKDVVERYNIQNDTAVLEDLLNITASAVGSLTNPTKLSKTFLSEKQIKISSATIDKYLDYFVDAFLIYRANRQEETHIMENVLYLDLIRRGYDVDVGVVEQNIKTPEGKKLRKQLEVDFVVNRGDERYYIQSALSVAEPEKRKHEIESLIRIPDSFKKIVITRDYIKPWTDENGIQYVGVEQFLLDKNALSV